MKILWIVNIVMPELSDHMGIQSSSSGTWLFDIARRLSDNTDIQLSIAAVHGDKFQKKCLGNTTYYLLPGNGKNMLFYTKKFESLWKKIDEDFQPDIIHIHGTEYSHGLACVRALPKKKYVISIQGILNRIKDVDFGGLTLFDVLLNRTLRENIRCNGMIEMHLLHKRNAIYEKELINKVKYASCVNFWDSSLTKAINPSIQVFTIDYNLREDFYQAPKWNIENIEPFSIFTNPGGTPLKGIHQLFKALDIVRKVYPQTKLYIPGMGNSKGRLIISSGYTKYLGKLLEKLGLENNVVFLERQSGAEIINRMRRANLVVIPSAIEGTSLILREAMFIGCPCIAAFRGGMADYITDKYDGYLYDYQEYPYLAERIIQVFEDKNIQVLSNRAIKKAESSQNPVSNYNNYNIMYEKIINSK